VPISTVSLAESSQMTIRLPQTTLGVTRDRYPRLVVSVAALIWLTVLLLSGAGCSGPDTAGSGMGMSGGTSAVAGVSSESTGFAMGSCVVAARRNAAISLGDRATSGGVRTGIPIADVRAPADGWLVVRSTTPPGAVLGKVRVKRGSNTGLTVPLDRLDSPNVRVALHVDSGARGTFEFDPTARNTGPDRAIFVAGRRLERPLTLEGFGQRVAPGTALVKVENQQIMDGSLSVSYLLVPGPSWVVVSTVGDNGLPAERIGLIGRAAGEAVLVLVPLSRDVSRGERLAVTTFADGGMRDVFEFDPRDPLGSPDRPYVSSGAIVSQRITAQ